MERIVSATPYYYGASKQCSNNIRFFVEMKEEIDAEMFVEAVQHTMKRYPYFCVRVVTTEKEMYLEENTEEVVVKHTQEPITLGGGEANGHLLAFSWWEENMYVDVFHGLADATAVMPLLRTLIYYYCKERYDSNLSPEGIRLSGDTIPEEEIRDPYPESVDESIQPIGRYERKPAFNLMTAGLYREESGNPTWFEIMIPEESFMKYNRGYEGSPAVVIAVLMSRAIDELHSDREAPIVCSMAMNIRKTLNAVNAHHSLVTQLFLEYKDIIQKMSIQDQITCYRGMIMMQSQDENIWCSVRGNLKINERINALPDLASKRMMMQQIVGSCIGLDTFKVSYAGKNNLGAAEKYVKGIHTVLDISQNSPLLEMNAVNGWFQIAFLQDSSDDVYVKALLRQLEQEGIEYQYREGGSIKVASIDL